MISDKVLNNDEKEVLKHGLKYCLPPRKPKFVEHFLPFEILHNNILQITKLVGEAKNTVSSKIRFLAHETFKYKEIGSNPFKSTLVNLKKDDSIVITRPEKGDRSGYS